jgi:hypothetical protein
MSHPLTQRYTDRYTRCSSDWMPSALARALEWSGMAYQGRITTEVIRSTGALFDSSAELRRPVGS